MVNAMTPAEKLAYMQRQSAEYYKRAMNRYDPTTGETNGRDLQNFARSFFKQYLKEHDK